ncbi:unnamed protein product [Prunus armeniaca]
MRCLHRPFTAVIGKAVTLDMGAAGLKPRPSPRPWPRPSLRTWVKPAKVRAVIPTMGEAVTLDMGATEVLSQTNVAKLESSYQALPSSSITLQFLHGLIRRKVILPQGREGVSATSWPWPTSTFQGEGWLVDSRRGKPIWIRPRREDPRIWLNPGSGEATRGAIRAS